MTFNMVIVAKDKLPIMSAMCQIISITFLIEFSFDFSDSEHAQKLVLKCTHFQCRAIGIITVFIACPKEPLI
jgi:hypothetical protein